MATKQYTFTGPIKWAKVWPGQIDTHFAFEFIDGVKVPSKAGGKWDIIVNLAGEQLAHYNALGTKPKAARLDDPEKGISKGDVRFKRHERHPYLGVLGPPAVTGVDAGTLIGNGSICDVVVDVYDYPQPDGTRAFTSRLVSVNVIDFVPYVKESTETPV